MAKINIIISTIYNHSEHYKKKLLGLLSGFSTIDSDKGIEQLLEMTDSDIWSHLKKHPKNKYKSHDKEQRRAEFRANAVLPLIKKDINTYLDIGCGDGSITVEIGRQLQLEKVCGIDCESFAGKDIQPIELPNDIEFDHRVYNGVEIPYEENTFDLITMMQVFHHVERPAELLQNIHKVLKKDGLVILREHYKENEIDSLFFRLEHILYSIFDDDSTIDHFFAHYYDNYYSRNELVEIFRQHGFEYLYMSEVPAKYNFANYYYIAFISIS
jgi:2-polyprenyl-3-methyl-5-hydroxy-6-metoxy-1,4-benzoquinol methylase